MKMILLGQPFMLPFWKHEAELIYMSLDKPVREQLAGHEDAAFALGYPMAGAEGKRMPDMLEACEWCREYGVPTVWHTIEDPTAFSIFVGQAKGYDLVCTSDCELLGTYQQHHPSSSIAWLPMAAQPAIHSPRPLAENATDFVLMANYYRGPERMEAHDHLIGPLMDAGYTLALYAMEGFLWPERYQRWYRGASYYTTCAEHYPEGRIALALNNWARNTGMCSMRTFEAMACGKPVLSYHCDAYEKLGFVNSGPTLEKEGHLIWVDNQEDSLLAARTLLNDPSAAQAMADRGRDFVLKRHTYKQRLEAILENVCEHALQPNS